MTNMDKARRARVRSWRAAYRTLDGARDAFVQAEKLALTAIGRAPEERYLDADTLIGATRTHAPEQAGRLVRTWNAYQVALDRAEIAESHMKASDFPVRW